MSGLGGGKPGSIRAFWDADSSREVYKAVDNHLTISEIINRLNSRVEELEKKVKDLEEAYMEEKLLGSTNGKIGT